MDECGLYGYIEPSKEGKRKRMKGREIPLLFSSFSCLIIIVWTDRLRSVLQQHFQHICSFAQDRVGWWPSTKKEEEGKQSKRGAFSHFFSSHIFFFFFFLALRHSIFLFSSLHFLLLTHFASLPNLAGVCFYSAQGIPIIVSCIIHGFGMEGMKGEREKSVFDTWENDGGCGGGL